MSLDRRKVLQLASALGLVTSASRPVASRATGQDAEDAKVTRCDIVAAMHGIEGLNLPSGITVIGLGGFGSWPALFSALAGVEEMLVADPAEVSVDDLGRTPYRASDVGSLKTDAIEDLIRSFRPNVSITKIPRFIEPEDSDIYLGTVFFDGTDEPNISSAFPALAAEHDMKYVHGFYHGNIIGTADHFPTDMRYIEGNVAPVWPVSAALAGLLAVYSAFTVPINYWGELDQLRMHPSELDFRHGPAK